MRQRPRIALGREARQVQDQQLAAIKLKLNAAELRYRLRLAELKRIDETETEWVMTGRGVGGSQQTTSRVVDGLPERRIPRTVEDRADVAKGGM